MQVDVDAIRNEHRVALGVARADELSRTAIRVRAAPRAASRSDHAESLARPSGRCAAGSDRKRGRRASRRSFPAERRGRLGRGWSYGEFARPSGADARCAGMPIRLLIADDHRLILRALHRVLGRRTTSRSSAEARRGSQVLPLHPQTSPDVCLLDVTCPRWTGSPASSGPEGRSEVESSCCRPRASRAGGGGARARRRRLHLEVGRPGRAARRASSGARRREVPARRPRTRRRAATTPA